MPATNGRLSRRRAQRDVVPVLLCLALALALAVALPAPSSAQGTAQSLHWGGIALPELDSYWELSITLDRFTTTHKPDDFRDTIPWAIDENIGLNMLVLSRVLPLHGRRGTVRLYGQAGYTHDDPTEFLQNNFLHYFNDLSYVPDTVPFRSEFDVAIGAEANGFIDLHPSGWDWLDLNMPIFFGGGGVWGTVYSEAYVQVGAHSQSWRIAGGTWPALSYLLRAGLYVEGVDAFPRGTLDNSHLTHQVVLTIPLDRWWDATAAVPTIRFGYTTSSGIFLRERGGEPLAETFCSFQFEWLGGDFVVETYNDTCGDKDTGPSYGVRTMVRWRDSLREIRQGI